MSAPSATVDAFLRVLNEGLEAGDGWPRIVRRLNRAGVPTVPPGGRWTLKKVKRFVAELDPSTFSDAGKALLDKGGETALRRLSQDEDSRA